MQTIKEHPILPSNRGSKPQANSTLSIKRNSMQTTSGSNTRVLSPVNVPKHI